MGLLPGTTPVAQGPDGAAGVTDLMDPFGNFRVACDYMAELLRRYDVESALTAYNSGHPGHSDYARTVMGYWEELKNG